MEPTVKQNNEGRGSSTTLLEEGRLHNPSLCDGLKEDVNRMKGDAIGNTLYSECWVIKILMKLTKFCPENWSENMETELCLLWDMTIEADVVELLMQHNFLELTSQIIHNTTIPRLMEILVGIIGNLSCTASVRAAIAGNMNIVNMLLELLSLPDVPTLLQLMRLLQACFWDLRNSETKTSFSGYSIEQSLLHEDKPERISKHEIGAEDLKLSISPSVACSVDGDNEKDLLNHKCATNIVKQSANKDNLCEDSTSKHHVIDEDFQLVESCVKGLERSRLNSCTLQEFSQDDCKSDQVKIGVSDRQLDLKEAKERSIVDSIWLEELSDINKWLPSIIFILGSSTNEELLRTTLALLDTLCYVPINNDLLGRYIASSDTVEALVEALDQLHQECKKGDELSPNVDLEKAVCHWAAVLSAFSSFPEGKVALANHAEAICSNLCTHLMIDEFQNQLDDHQAEFIILAATLMSSFLEHAGYFHPPIFNCFLSILAFLRGRHTTERNGYVKDETEKTVNDSSTQGTQHEVIDNLEKYFEDVIQFADGGALAHVLQHCNKQHVAILQSVMEGQKSSFINS